MSLLSGLFNLRGNDVPHNPFFYAYTLLTMQEIWQAHLRAAQRQPHAVTAGLYSSIGFLPLFSILNPQI